MKREMTKTLARWKDSPRRKPLLLKGARQTGKTWLLRDFGERFYDDAAYINLDEEPGYRQLFQETKNPARLIPNLSMALGRPIRPESTLIIFDEIQGCPEAISSLKYFCEEAPEYHVAGAGSLLGVATAKPASFPVGKVNYLSMYPMNFREFLDASGKRNLVEYIDSIDETAPIPELFSGLLLEELRFYFLTGGMPEAVLAWTSRRDPTEADMILSDLNMAYERDFSKHPDSSTFPKISRIWESLPSQLARENKKFLYGAVKSGARAREYEDALQWLLDAGLAYRVPRASAPSLPLSAYDETGAFKIYMHDVGVLRRQSHLASSAVLEGNRLFTEFKGALAENYVLQSLIPALDLAPRYWARSNPPYEVDFLIQHQNEVLPVEVKAGTNVRGTSLKKYGRLYEPRLKVRFSLENLRLDGDVLNIPLYLADEALRLISLALSA